MNQRFLLPLLLLALLLTACAVAWCQMHCRGRRTACRSTDFREAGFRVIALPQEEDIAYGDIWLIDGRVGEVRFEVEHTCAGILRAAVSGTDLQLEDFRQDYDTQGVYDADGITITLRQTPGGPYLFTWSRSGFDYALYFPFAEMGLADGLCQSFIQSTVSSRR